MTSPRSERAAGGEPAFDREQARLAVLEAALVHVPFDGWTLGALKQGAREGGFDPAMALRVFPGGPLEAVEFWCARADREMMQALGRRDLAGVKVRERIAIAVRARLEGEARHREAVRRALGLLGLPHNAPRAAATLWRTVDAIWYAAGDTATDFNFYTKRALLAGVYGVTLLYWLDDRSAGAADTWAFLDRRIADVMRVPTALGDLGSRLAGLLKPWSLFGGRFGRS
ncbi:MAG: COQ9 family protein [Pseudomonadota bacterium]